MQLYLTKKRPTKSTEKTIIMKAKKPFLILLLCYLWQIILVAQRGKNGNVTINTTNQVINAYTTLTADAPAGSTLITVANSALGSNFSQNLSAGDLIMIIQMQGATLNASVNPWDNTLSIPQDSTWGAVLQYNNCGNHEFVEVAAVPNGTTIQLNCPLQYSYTAAGKVQVIRVPRYNNFTINNGASVTAPAWNGSTGGIVAIEVLGNCVINGQINVTGLGFRGGTVEQQSLMGGGQWGSTSPSEGAMKGESIGGWQTEYATFAGIYCKGAPANGGGGGTAHNGGGGGGANAGNINAWSGKGNPDISNANYIQAWNLETPPLSSLTSSGGGRGGYTFSNSNQNELTVPPGNTAWGGDYRRNMGGLGGRPLDYSTGRIFMGGGGGAGDANNPFGGAGGNGGGIVYLITYNTVTGNGSINANGAPGGDSQGNGNPFSTTGNDGAGGGGGGGTILIKASNVTGITLNANGGNGGNQILTGLTPNEAEGPGGGGGGGYIAVSNGSPTQNVAGGNNGTSNSPHITNFPPNGATKGGTGLSNQPLSFVTLSASNDTTVCLNSSATLYAFINGSFSGNINWYDAPFGGNIVGTGTTFTTPPITAKDTFWVGLCPGQYRIRIIVDVTTCPVPVAAFSASDTTFCAGNCINFTDLSSNSPTTWSWTFPGGIPASSTLQNPSNICFNTPGNYTVQLTASNMYGSSTTSLIITVTAPPSATANASPNPACEGQTVTLTSGPNNTSYNWTGPNGFSSMQQNPVLPNVTNAESGSYTVTITDGNGCSNTATVNLTVNALPSVSAASNAPLCEGDTLILTCLPGGMSSYLWTGPNGFTSTQQNPTVNNVSVANTGNYTISVSDANGCSNSATIAVIISPPPTAGIYSSSSTICAGDTLYLIGSGNGSYSWTENGTPAGTGTNLLINPMVTSLYELIVSMGSCSDTASVTITVNPLPIINTTPPSATLCAGDTLTLTANGAISYSWTPATGLSATSGSTVNASPSSTTIYYVEGTDANGCSDSVSITIIVNPLPVISITPSSATICEGDTLLISANGAVTYNWTPATSLSSTNGSSVYAFPSDTITYTVNGTDINGCNNTETLTIYVTPKPIAAISGDLIICEGENTTLTATGGTPYEWLHDGSTTQSINVNPVQTTSYSVVVGSGNCKDTAVVTVTVNTPPQATASPDTTIEMGEQVQLIATGGINYEWTPATGLSCTNCATPIAKPMETTDYCIRVTDANGCEDNACLRIVVIFKCGEIYVPNIISPNGDGQNDEAKVYGNCIDQMEWHIFDRWGNEVFKTSSPDETWDGTHNKKGVTEGVYFYWLKIITRQQEIKEMKGSITVIR